MPSFLNILVEFPSADRPEVSAREDGRWEYRGTNIAAVGARGLTLEEKLSPLMISRPGQEPVAVLLPLAEVSSDPRLDWALAAGKELEGDEEPMLQVPFSLWQEHAQEIVGVWVPERDAKGVDKRLAIAEREFRFTQRAMEEARLVRNCLVVLATHLGRSRREVGETLGLSLGRVQQLNENPPPEVMAIVEELVMAVELLAKNIGRRPCPREDVPKPRALSREELDDVIELMLMLGLLKDGPDGLELTSDGITLVDVTGPVKRKELKSSRDRERAGDATK
jgi:hypothetical protein